MSVHPDAAADGTAAACCAPCSEAEHTKVLEEAARMRRVVVDGVEDDKLFAEEPSVHVVSLDKRCHCWQAWQSRRADRAAASASGTAEHGCRR